MDIKLAALTNNCQGANQQEKITTVAVLLPESMPGEPKTCMQ
jgi:hypothetical protein